MKTLFIKKENTFDKIRSGSKTIELRLLKEGGFFDTKKFEIGEEIEFEQNKEKCRAIITDVKIFKNFQECVNKLDINNVFGYRISQGSLLDHYNKLYVTGFNEHPIIAISFKLVN